MAPRGQSRESAWQQTIQRYSKEYPEEAEEFHLRVQGKMPGDWTELIPSKEELPTEPTASRKSAGIIGNPLGEKLKNFLIGTADLTPSCNVAYSQKVDFQSVRDSSPGIHPSAPQELT